MSVSRARTMPGTERTVEVSAQQLHEAGLNFIVVVPRRMASSRSQQTAVPFHDRVEMGMYLTTG